MLLSSFQIQFRVFKALFIREMISHFGRRNIGFLWMFVEPMLFSIGIAILWTMTGHGHGQISPAGFALTGYSAIIAWRNCVSRTAVAVEANKGLLFHRNVTILDLAVTRGIFEFSAATVSLVSLTIIFIALDLIKIPSDILTAITAWGLLGWFFISAGLIALYLNQKSELFERVWHIIMYLTLPLTGAFTMVDWLPSDFQSVMLLSPMVNGVEMLREGFFGPKINAHYSIYYVVVFNFATTALGLFLTCKVKKLVDSE
jgi:capsular polysaccharide transport system permease protein